MPFEKREALFSNVVKVIDENLEKVSRAIAEQWKQSRHQDLSQALQNIKTGLGQQTKKMTLRILEQLLLKEKARAGMRDFSDMLSNSVFISSVFVCAQETTLYISNDKSLTLPQMLKEIDLKAFDFWRILNGFIKYDPHMPKQIKLHFREIEINVVSEYAWEPQSPVVQVIRKLCSEYAKSESEQNRSVLAPY